MGIKQPIHTTSLSEEEEYEYRYRVRAAAETKQKMMSPLKRRLNVVVIVIPRFARVERDGTCVWLLTIYTRFRLWCCLYTRLFFFTNELSYMLNHIHVDQMVNYPAVTI